MLDLHSVEVFREVYLERSYTKAARKLHMTQSAVSQQVKKLEEHLTVQLFDQQDRVQPTLAGDYFFQETGQLLGQVHDTINQLKTLEGIGSGLVKYGMIDVVAIELLPRILSGYRRKHPLVKLASVVKTSRELIELVQHHELDFAVVVMNDLPEDVLGEKLYDDSFIAVVPPASDLAYRSKLHLRDLAQQELILYPEGSLSRQLIDFAFAKIGVSANVSMEMHYPEAMESLVAQGLGVAIMSELSVRQKMLPARCYKPLSELKKQRRLGIVRHRRRRLSLQAESFMNELAQLKKGYLRK